VPAHKLDDHGIYLLHSGTGRHNIPGSSSFADFSLLRVPTCFNANFIPFLYPNVHHMRRYPTHGACQESQYNSSRSQAVPRPVKVSWYFLETMRLVGRWCLFRTDTVCIYQDRYRSKCCKNLRLEPQFCEVGFAYLACRIGKFTLRVFIMEIYQYLAVYCHLAIPPSRRLARSSSQYDYISLL
jgi:hypothetical protein